MHSVSGIPGRRPGSFAVLGSRSWLWWYGHPITLWCHVSWSVVLGVVLVLAIVLISRRLE
jgi:hypothetical protein